MYTGWKETVHDAHILLDALSQSAREFSLPPEDKYYIKNNYLKKNFHIKKIHNLYSFICW